LKANSGEDPPVAKKEKEQKKKERRAQLDPFWAIASCDGGKFLLRCQVAESLRGIRNMEVWERETAGAEGKKVY